MLANNAASMEEFFEDYFDLLDPVGAEENIQYTRRVEEDAMGIENHFMGHLLVNDVEQFRSLVQAGPANLVNELLGIVGTLELVITRFPLPKHAYEDPTRNYTTLAMWRRLRGRTRWMIVFCSGREGC